MNRKTLLLTAGAAFAAAVALSGTTAHAAAGGEKGRPTVQLPDQWGSTPTELRNIPPEIDRGYRDTFEHDRPKPFHVSHATDAADPVAQTSAAGASVAVTSATSFDGVGIKGNPAYAVNAAPPDTNGAVGATQYVQWVNEAFAVYDKATGAVLYGPANGNTLWKGFGGPCETSNDGDPIALYDKLNGRWIMTQFAVSAQPYLQCVAVSQTSDALGKWNLYSYSYGNQFNDYPKVGVWSNGYYVTYNMFLNGQTFSGGKMCGWDGAAMRAGSPTAVQVCFDTPNDGGQLPADIDGRTLPPAGSPEYVVSFGTNALNVYKLYVDFANPSASTMTSASVPVASFSEACGGGTCVVQPSTTQKLDSLGDRMMYRLSYRNLGTYESLLGNHSVKVGTSRKNPYTGVRWYELRNLAAAVPTVYQQGTYAPDTSFRWMASIAQDKVGNIAVGYSVSSSSVYPSIRFATRAPADALGTMSAETSIFAGTGAQLRNLSRWGDYSALTVDPVDDCTFWYTTEYLKANGTFNWSTRIGNFKLATCQ